MKNAYTKKKKIQINNLILYLKKIEKEEQTQPVSRRKKTNIGEEKQ